MSEKFRGIDPIGFRIEAGPNTSQNPEILGGTEATPDSPSTNTPELSSKISGVALAAVVAFGDVLKPQNTGPSESETL